MGCSESIHNDTTNPVEVWFQLDGGICPFDGCDEMILEPGAATSKKKFSLSLANELCVKYSAPDGKELVTRKVCKKVTSPAFGGQHVMYNVGDIITTKSDNVYGIPSTAKRLEFAGAVLALAVFMLFIIMFRSSKNEKEKEEGLKEKLLEAGTIANTPNAVSKIKLTNPRRKERPRVAGALEKIKSNQSSQPVKWCTTPTHLISLPQSEDQTDSPEVVVKALADKANIAAQNDRGRTALHYVANTMLSTRGSSATLRSLVEAKAPLDQGDASRSSASLSCTSNAEQMPKTKCPAILSSKYQDLLCIKCGANVRGHMLIRLHLGQPIKFASPSCSSNGFIALCPAHYSENDTKMRIEKQILQHLELCSSEKARMIAIEELEGRLDKVQAMYTPEALQNFLSEHSKIILNSVEDRIFRSFDAVERRSKATLASNRVSELIREHNQQIASLKGSTASIQKKSKK